ncbi:hypothetical protein BC941DRAFT_514534 [Chlamydoabsidia padenii]|nr:hypothetical protein BC941DRAFT_514534 [Chlamydoabsidia padenii]
MTHLAISPKQYNKYDRWSTACAALPFEGRNRRENAFSLGAVTRLNGLSAMDALPKTGGGFEGSGKWGNESMAKGNQYDGDDDDDDDMLSNVTINYHIRITCDYHLENVPDNEQDPEQNSWMIIEKLQKLDEYGGTLIDPKEFTRNDDVDVQILIKLGHPVFLWCLVWSLLVAIDLF